MKYLLKKEIHKDYINLIIWITGLILIGSFIGNSTKNNIDSWYNTLDRSSLTPPSYIFSIVWTILYTLIAISGWIIWKAIPDKKIKAIKKIYISQLILNWSWTPLFFTCQLTGLSLLCVNSIILLVAMLIFKSYKTLKTVSLLLLPYLLWLMLASYLNFYIWLYN